MWSLDREMVRAVGDGDGRLHITEVSPLVNDEHLDAAQPRLEPRELAGVARLEELAHEVGGAREEHPVRLFGRFDAEGNRQVGLPGPNGPGQDEILGRGDPLPAGQGVDLRGIHVGLIRFGGHLPKGGYDVPTDGTHLQEPAHAPAV